MNYLSFVFFILIFLTKASNVITTPEHFKHVDQVIWVVDDLNEVAEHWKNLGFEQIEILDNVKTSSNKNKTFDVKMAVANLGGAQITWIQPLTGNSVFSIFKDNYGNGAMSLVHQLSSELMLENEIERLSELGVAVLNQLTFSTSKGKLKITLMDTWEKGKYVLGYVTYETSTNIHTGLTAKNRHNLQLNQYAFAINEAEEISEYWKKIGFPGLQISHPELGETKYHGKIVDHQLIQGWQRQGDIAYEWCIPVKGPIVYADHINIHGEGIHHLAFSVKDMDKVLKDFESRGYENTMGGTWGEKEKPGSGRYEYVGLEDAGGMTMELLWSYQDN